MNTRFDSRDIQSLRGFYEKLASDDDIFGSFGKPSNLVGNSRSPMHPVGNSFPNAALMDPRLFGGNPVMFSPTHPMYMQATSISPQDPRLMYEAMRTPGYPPAVYAGMSGPYGPLGLAAPPALPYSTGYYHQPVVASRSQPVFRTRDHSRSAEDDDESSSSSSSDSDNAEAISRHIMSQEEDPKRLQKMINRRSSNRRKQLRRNKTDTEYIVRDPPTRVTLSRDNSLPSLVEEWTELVDGLKSDARSRRRDPREEKKPKERRVKSDNRVRRSSKKAARDLSSSHKRRRERSSRGLRRESSVDQLEYPADANESWFNLLREDEAVPVLADRRPEKKLRKEKTNYDKSGGRVKPSKLPVGRSKSVPPSSVALVPSRRVRHHQRPSVGRKEQTWWDPAQMVTGKRQRLPVLDWRKGEKYCRAPDGTVIGKEGFSKLVFDDEWIFEKKQKKRTDEGSTEDDYEERQRSPPQKRHPKREHKAAAKPALLVVQHKPVNQQPPPNRTSNASLRQSLSPPQIIQLDDLPIPISDSASLGAYLESAPATSPKKIPKSAFDFLKKNEEGIYTVGKFQLLHRREDRAWTEHDVESGFMMSPSLAVETGFVAQICLEPNMPEANLETLAENQTMYVNVLQSGESNAIRLLVNGHEELLNEGDLAFIDPGSSYSITNVSSNARAVLLVTMSH